MNILIVSICFFTPSTAGTLRHYLTCGRSLKDICEALFTHRNTALYRIHKTREDFAAPLDDPAAHTALLLSTALPLLDSKDVEFL